MNPHCYITGEMFDKNMQYLEKKYKEITNTGKENYGRVGRRLKDISDEPFPFKHDSAVVFGRCVPKIERNRQPRRLT